MKTIAFWKTDPRSAIRRYTPGIVLVLLGLSIAIIGSLCRDDDSEPRILPLAVAGHTLWVEIADTPRAIWRGLMDRDNLPDEHGMLFIFPEERIVGMWMKNTRIPVSVAFIDREFRIQSIADMEPYSLEIHRSDGPVRYALEVNRGWFQRHGFGPDDALYGVHLKTGPARDAEGYSG